MSEIKIVEYEVEDKEACIALLKETFSGKSDKETFEWRFGPSNRQPLLICAKHNNKVISFNSWIPWEFCINNSSYLAYQSGESATDKNYRRKGIWGKVLEYGEGIAKKRDIDFFFGFPSRMSYNALYKAGYNPIGTFCFRLRMINPFCVSRERKKNCEMEELLHRRLLESNKVTPALDSNYFEWRYTKNPKDYEIVEYSENNNIALFVVRNSKWHNKISNVTLLDCHFTSYNDAFIRKAFNYLDGVFARKAVFIKTFFNENTHRGKALKKQFFVEVKSYPMILAVKPLRDTLDRSILFDYNYWDIMPHVVDEY